MTKPCIIESIGSDGTYSCFARDYELWCPFATQSGIEKYSCRSGTGKCAFIPRQGHP
jgi:hypothetical protein